MKCIYCKTNNLIQPVEIQLKSNKIEILDVCMSCICFSQWIFDNKNEIINVYDESIQKIFI